MKDRRTYMRNYMRTRRERCLEEELCVICCRRKSREGTTTCLSCRRAQTNRMRKLRAEARMQEVRARA